MKRMLWNLKSRPILMTDWFEDEGSMAFIQLLSVKHFI